MKKLLLILGIVAAGYVKSQAASIVVNGTTNGFYLISTNRASVYNVEVTSANPATIQLFDMDTVAVPFFGTNYTNAAFTYRITTNATQVTNYVGSNGYTNWFTNVGVYTVTLTNAANTNALPAMAAFVVAGGTYAVYNVDALFARGICATITTNASMVINYRP